MLFFKNTQLLDCLEVAFRILVKHGSESHTQLDLTNRAVLLAQIYPQRISLKDMFDITGQIFCLPPKLDLENNKGLDFLKGLHFQKCKKNWKKGYDKCGNVKCAALCLLCMCHYRCMQMYIIKLNIYFQLYKYICINLYYF